MNRNRGRKEAIKREKHETKRAKKKQKSLWQQRGKIENQIRSSLRPRKVKLDLIKSDLAKMKMKLILKFIWILSHLHHFKI